MSDDLVLTRFYEVLKQVADLRTAHAARSLKTWMAALSWRSRPQAEMQLLNLALSFES